MAISTEDIKDLRQATGISIAQCKKALEEADGDKTKALEILKAKGADIVGKKSDRDFGAGFVNSYIHAGGSIGTLVELSCETDFVSKNEEFGALVFDLGMHIAAANPENIESLLEQEFIKDPSLKIGDLIQEATQKFGERVEITRFSRFAVGE